METVATTKMSPTGRVMIPEDVRIQLKIHAGDNFIVFGSRDTIILKSITPATIEDFETLTAESRKQAQQAGLKKSDIKVAIQKARKK
jgi:AbrB family looped-hinge helix DNA binding protein